MRYNRQSEQGFTIVELMIAVLIGLIVSAAAAQIYATSIRTSATQKAAAGILDANVYGLQHIENSLRMAGLGLNGATTINSACSGILIANPTSISTPEVMQCLIDQGAFDVPLTQNATWWSWPQPLSGAVAPNTDNASTPQLTIQYRAPMHMRDCEGNVALGPRRIKGVTRDTGTLQEMDVDGQVIVERYFVRRNNDGALELRCDAGRYVVEAVEAELSNEVLSNKHLRDAAIIGFDAVSQISNFDDEGALVISGIDDFQVKFGVKTAGGIIYQTMAEYLNPSNTGTREIVAVKMAILAKGLVAASNADMPATNPTYVMLGDEVQMAAGQPTNFIRRVYETNTMLRNARGGE